MTSGTQKFTPVGVRTAAMIAGALAFVSPCTIAQTNPLSLAALDPLTEKIPIAVVSATLSLIAGLILFQLKERREPRKRLSYDLEIRHGLVKIDESISRNVCLTYKGLSADKLAYVRCDIRNTGNGVIKAELLRFDLSEGNQVLDAYTDPAPPMEYGVSELNDRPLGPHERRYRIQHLEKQQEVAFRFVVSGTRDIEPKIIPFNDQGDVTVTAASISRAADERRFVEQFFFLLILCFVVPPIVRFLPEPLYDIASGFIYGMLAIAMAPLIRPFSRVAARALAAVGRSPHANVMITELHQEQAAALCIATAGSSPQVLDRAGRTDPDHQADVDIHDR